MIFCSVSHDWSCMSLVATDARMTNVFQYELKEEFSKATLLLKDSQDKTTFILKFK